MRILLAAFLLIAPPAAHAYKVVSVADGDSMTLQVGRSRLKLRLAGIDAPETRQAFGRQAAQSLRQLCSGQDAQYDAIAIDRFGRTVATVRCNGIDAGRTQVERGMAWASARSGSELKALETIARSSRSGLWSALHPVPPWDFRHRTAPDATCHIGPRGGRYQWINGRKAYGC
ncbi:MAG: Micrococcal nuclease [Collimonas fungivorans]|uniref:thermonuclease family protein n=1 Tax=Collimonas fungivorans TaxID=158899 RepID=UPI0026E983CA|nr:thermonuclease family protein [Collimonas fungivorans]MDB5768853.1 Micrococcal nuclease [Collimonas fungivorans]